MLITFYHNKENDKITNYFSYHDENMNSKRTVS